MGNKIDTQAVIQNLLNKVGALEYQNTLLQVENDNLKKQVTNAQGKEDK